MEYFEDQLFAGRDFQVDPLHQGSYEYCTFQNCNFAEADLTGIRFLECRFEDCNLSNMTVLGTSWQEVQISHSKLLGIHFDQCNPVGFKLMITHSRLAHILFVGMKLPDTNFSDCTLDGVDFSDANLQGASFQRSVLAGVIFDNTDLRKADFRDATGYRISPVHNPVKGANFSRNAIDGLLIDFGVFIE